MSNQAPIKREFKGLPVKEAKHELPLIIMQEDIERAKGQEKDFGNCIFANCCARQYHADKIAIMRTTAYVSMPDGKGKKVVYRYMVPEDARSIIERFDTGKDIEPGSAFYLRPPKETETLDHIRELRKSSKRKKKRYLQGEMSVEEEEKFEKISENNRDKALRGVQGRKNNGGYNDTSNVFEMDVRHGTGAVGFSRKKVLE